jgi:tRNA-Thr(GGU) m(6)t(6)A37 methyltransferase TsaA
LNSNIASDNCGDTRILKYELHPIGIIHTPHETSNDAPIQSAFSKFEGTAEIYPDYIEGLDSLEGFSHIILLYWFHRAREPRMKVVPYMDVVAHGLFATRTPSRPNPIGLSIVELLGIESGKIRFKGADMLNETPLLDIKPFVSQFDGPTSTKIGWLEKPLANENRRRVGDSRFEE